MTEWNGKPPASQPMECSGSLQPNRAKQNVEINVLKSQVKCITDMICVWLDGKSHKKRG